MADKSFDRVILNVRERPLSSDINRMASQHDRTLRDLLARYVQHRTSTSDPTSQPPPTGFIGDSYRVVPVAPAAMQVKLLAGQGFFFDAVSVPSAIGGVSGLDDLSAYKPLFLGADQVINVPASDPVNPRIDIVEVKYDRRTTDSSSRDILDPSSGAFGSATVNKTLTWFQDGQVSVNGSASINYKTGTPGGVPVAPTVSAGYVRIAQVRVNALVTTIADEGVIGDFRVLLYPHGMGQFSCRVAMPFLDGGGAAQPTLSNVIAPPGVRIAVTGENQDLPRIRLYIFAGDLPTATNCWANIEYNVAILVAPTMAFVSRNFLGPTDLHLNFISSTEKTAIEGANGNPAGIKVALGAPRIAYEIAALAESGGNFTNGTNYPNPVLFTIHGQIQG